MRAAECQQGSGFGGSRKYRLAVVERDDLVIATMNDQHGTVHIADVIARRVIQSAQPARWESWIELLGDIGHGGERRFHDEC